MASILKSLRLLAEPSRVRILLLLEQEELSVAELQEVLGMGQSTISTYLAQLKQVSLVEDRRTGKNILYSLKPGVPKDMLAVLRGAATEIPEAADDAEALKLALGKRQDKMRGVFRRVGRQIRPPVRAGAKLAGARGDAADTDAAAGDRRPGRRRGYGVATSRPAGEARYRRRQLREDGRVRL